MKAINFIVINPIGNITALVKDAVPKNRRAFVANKIMSKFSQIEQVGFMIGNKLEMMGGELSVNATLAFGYYLSQKLKRNSLKFETSGIPNSVRFQRTRKSSSSITLTIPGIKKSKIDGFDFVDLKGIAYFVINESFVKKDRLSTFKIIKRKFGKKIEQKAWGVVFYQMTSQHPVLNR